MSPATAEPTLLYEEWPGVRRSIRAVVGRL
jgi:hypothetical protein